MSKCAGRAAPSQRRHPAGAIARIAPDQVLQEKTDRDFRDDVQRAIIVARFALERPSVTTGPQVDRRVLAGWEDGRCPAVSGIVVADGRVALLDVMSDPIPEARRSEKRYAFRLRRAGTSSVDDLDRSGELQWSHIYRQPETIDTARNLRAWCGETSWGSEGFVALAAADTDHPIWIAILDGSNPFRAVTLTETTVEAISTYETAWSSPIESPEDATVD